VKTDDFGNSSLKDSRKLVVNPENPSVIDVLNMNPYLLNPHQYELSRERDGKKRDEVLRYDHSSLRNLSNHLPILPSTISPFPNLINSVPRGERERENVRLEKRGKFLSLEQKSQIHSSRPYRMMRSLVMRGVYRIYLICRKRSQRD